MTQYVLDGELKVKALLTPASSPSVIIQIAPAHLGVSTNKTELQKKIE